ncbi:MAG: DUF370 domain-containing protein [Clostridia bacterium]|nr:DUF370 domain-containing protein [Clostridia bacterium]
MYIHLGAETVVRSRHVIGIFDTDNTTLSKITRDYLSRAEKEGRVVTITYDLPKSFVICQNEDGEETVYLSQLSAATLKKRIYNNGV